MDYTIYGLYIYQYRIIPYKDYMEHSYHIHDNNHHHTGANNYFIMDKQKRPTTTQEKQERGK